MASADIYTAIKGHLQDSMQTVSVLDFDQIETALEQQTSSWVCIEEATSYEELISIGDPTQVCVREQSSLLIHCFVPAPESSATARALGDTVQGYLRQQIIDGVRITGTTPPDPTLLNDGIWSAVVISVDAQMDRHVAIAA